MNPERISKQSFLHFQPPKDRSAIIRGDLLCFYKLCRNKVYFLSLEKLFLNTVKIPAQGRDVIPKSILIEFIHSRSAIYVGLLGHVDKREGAQVYPNQWDVGSKMRDTLVDILKGLQVRQLHYHEKCLLEEVGDGGSFL